MSRHGQQHLRTANLERPPGCYSDLSTIPTVLVLGSGRRHYFAATSTTRILYRKRLSSATLRKYLVASESADTFVAGFLTSSGYGEALFPSSRTYPVH